MSRRALLAFVGAMLWLAGVEVAPNIHLALHDSLAEHTHEGDRVVYAHAHAHRTPKRDRDRELAMRLEHGAHSLAHHQVALHHGAPPPLAPLPTNVRPTVVPDLAIGEMRSIARFVAVARGPPARLLG